MFDGHGLDLGESPAAVGGAELRGRQAEICSRLEAGSILLIVNNPESIRSADVEYPYRSNSNMLYLIGWESPDAVACFHQVKGEWETRLYVPPRNVERETWTGIRAGLEGAEADYPIDKAVSIDEIAEDLSTLLSDCKSVYHVRGLSTNVDDILDKALLEVSRDRQRLGTGPVNLCDPRPLLGEMRLIKSDSEVEQMRHAARIASAAHIETMRHGEGNCGEYQLQAVIEGCFKHNQSQWSYPSIVGGGDHATILHYVENDAEIADGDLVLIDAGCEVNGYASDITRTWPINGKFSDNQRAIYQIVLDAEEAAIAVCRPGVPYDAPHDAARNIMAQGLLDLGIVAGPTLEDALSADQLGLYFMHNTSHWLGLDVHDVGVYRPDDKPRKLEVGMVMTIEPGLYFGAWRPDIEIDEKWAGIGIRIEDDVLITADGCDVLTKDCPKTISDLESVIGSA
jgi:Xaa-Pro aminopeptidase